jgi:pSer/pThr/pTyr-binding forkhead associated (FHA) protein
VFSVKGAKLGRDKDNDIRFPDEQSISNNHAKIMFKSDAFYLQDLGSKMGTYLKIIKRSVIENEVYIQFSTDVEVLFKVLQRVRVW